MIVDRIKGMYYFSALMQLDRTPSATAEAINRPKRQKVTQNLSLGINNSRLEHRILD